MVLYLVAIIASIAARISFSSALRIPYQRSIYARTQDSDRSESTYYIINGSCTNTCSSSASLAAARVSSHSSDIPPLTANPPRKICLIVEPTPFTHISGYSNRFNEMLKYLSKAGDEVHILTVDSKTPEKELPKEIYGFNIDYTIGFTFPLYKHISLSFDFPELKGAKIIGKFKPDIIHCSTPFITIPLAPQPGRGFIVFAAIAYARVMHIPIVLSYHTHLPSYARNYLHILPGQERLAWGLIRWVHSRADLTLVTSPQMREEMIAHEVPRVDVWRKGIDTVQFNPKFHDAEMRTMMTDGHENDFLIVYIGRIAAEKRLRDMKPILLKMGANTRLCFVGSGPQMNELKEYFKGTNTVFTGQLRGDALSKAFASADVFVMPSDSETLGFVVLESMASGVPVIGAAAGGIPDLIHDGEDGFLVPPGDTDAFVAKLKILQDDLVRKKMGQAGRVEAEKWSWEVATSYLRNIQYEKAMINFRSKGFRINLVESTSRRRRLWTSFKWKIQSIFHRLHIPGF